jgi:hypothetical protein
MRTNILSRQRNGDGFQQTTGKQMISLRMYIAMIHDALTHGSEQRNALTTREAGDWAHNLDAMVQQRRGPHEHQLHPDVTVLYTKINSNEELNFFC